MDTSELPGRPVKYVYYSADSKTASGTEGSRVFYSICKETGHRRFMCSQRTCITCCGTGHDPDESPLATKEKANLMSSAQAALVVDAESKSYEFAESNYC